MASSSSPSNAVRAPANPRRHADEQAPTKHDHNQLSDMPDFNDAAKLGSGKEMQERLPNLENAGIFSPATFPLSQITDEQGNQQGRTAKGDPGHTGESFIMHVCCIKDRFGRDWCQSGRI
jgi:hypothetical protein